MQSDDVNPFEEPNAEPTPVASLQDTKQKIPTAPYIGVICLFKAIILSLVLGISEVYSAGTWPSGTKLYTTIVLISLFAIAHIATVRELQKTDPATIRSSSPTLLGDIYLILSVIGVFCFLFWYFGIFAAFAKVFAD